MRKITNTKILLTLLAVLAGLVIIGAGCATAPTMTPPPGDDPAVQVQPQTIRLGVARLVNDTDIVIRGYRFAPEDSVFIRMTPAAEESFTEPDLVIADAVVDESGRFQAEVENLVKVTDFLQADLGLNKDMEKYIIITGPPIPTGTYRIIAESMESGKTAAGQLEVKGPSVGDRFKDWMGGLLGKIEKK